MSLSELPPSYCANVHPGESFDEAFAALDRYAAPLRRRLDRPIATGLWMTRDAIAEAESDPSKGDRLAHWLADHDLICYTMNAFPFGNFHARRVKENVYLPDWHSPQRREYTCQAADLLARLLPESTEGSISTSPCAFKPLHPPGTDASRYFAQLVETALYLDRLRQETGRTIRLAIEPEPCCVLETTTETIEFFRALRRHALEESAEQAVNDHLGVCFDVCHQAVEFEDVADSIRRLGGAGIRINKVHVTCALELRDPCDADARRHLARFVEERYLHQTFAQHPDGRTLSILDLSTEHAEHPPAEWLECPQWRIHFHVPVHEERLGPLHTTRGRITEALRAVRDLDYAPHLEVETYTWNVLPAQSAAAEPFDLVAGLQAEMSSTIALIADLAAERPVAG